MKGKESALSREGSLANIKLLCCGSANRDGPAGLEKVNASAAGKQIEIGTFERTLTENGQNANAL